MSDDARLCSRCHLPVIENAANYDIFERMHFVCFHYEWEHLKRDASGELLRGALTREESLLDPDVPCGLVGCPTDGAVTRK
jgi:hypothetical protein